MKALRIFLPVVFTAIIISGCATRQITKKSAYSLSEVFSDDFSSYGIGLKAPFGEWKIKNPGSYFIESTIQPDGTIGNVLKTDNNAIIFIPGDWKDYFFEVKTRDGEPGVFFRLTNNGNEGYYITKGLGYMTGIRLYKFAGNTKQMIAESKGFEVKGWWDVKIEVIGNTIVVYANGKKYMDIKDNDPKLSFGGVGLGSIYGGVLFDNVRVKTIK